MSVNTYIAPSANGRLVEQLKDRSWNQSEAYTQLRWLTSTFMCLASQADALRPVMGQVHPAFPQMFCDGRSVREVTTQTGVTYFTADYYGMRYSADEALIFQPRANIALVSNQGFKLKIRHCALGRPLDLAYVARLRGPRKQEIAPEYAAYGQPDLVYDSSPLSRPQEFVLESRNVSEYGIFSVCDDVWSTFTAEEIEGDGIDGSSRYVGYSNSAGSLVGDLQDGDAGGGLYGNSYRMTSTFADLITRIGGIRGYRRGLVVAFDPAEEEA